ncbi:MAG: hypothetical protein H6607_03900 [Flavobacteriales bacterium]|nr:hypothetical protein [Flavobacteriales bacterium]
MTVYLKDFEQDVLGCVHGKSWKIMAEHCVQNPELIYYLVEFLVGKNERVARRSAEILRFVHDKNTFLIVPYIPRLISRLNAPAHDAIVRCIFRIFQNCRFTDEQTGAVLTLAFNYLQDESNPIAVRTFAMTTIYNISKKYPELYDELVAVISENLDQQSAGFQNRAMKIINRTWKF